MLTVSDGRDYRIRHLKGEAELSVQLTHKGNIKFDIETIMKGRLDVDQLTSTVQPCSSRLAL